MPISETQYGCIYCRSGNEEQIIRELECIYPDVRCVFAKKMRIRRLAGNRLLEETVLFPGYKFFKSSSSDIDVHRIAGNTNIYRVLIGVDGDWQLTGSDKDIAKELFKRNGLFELSKAYYENGTLKIIEGPLTGLEDCIIDINKRAQTVCIKISINGEIIKTWLSYELMASEGEKQ